MRATALHWRLLWLTVAACALVLGGLAFLLRDQIEGSHRQLAEEAESLVIALRPLLVHALVVADLEIVQETFDRLRDRAAIHRIELSAPDGRSMLRVDKRHDHAHPGVPEWFHRLVAGRRATFDHPLRVGGVAYGTLHLELDNTDDLDNLWRLALIYIGGGGIALALLLGASVWLMRRALTDLERLAEGARRIGGGDLTQRIDVVRTPEIAEVAARFNAMVERLRLSREELDAHVGELLAQRARLGAFQAALAALIRDPQLGGDDLAAAVRRVATALREALGVDHVGVWAWRGAGLEPIGGAAAAGGGALEPVAPDADYRATLERGEPIIADDATRHPAIRGHGDPRGARLDLPILQSGHPWGVLRCECHGAARAWRPEEIGLAAAVAALLAQTIEGIDRRAAQAQALSAKVAAEQSSAAKSEFLSRMSHELRTPLNAILGFGQLMGMDDAPLPPTQAANLHEILEAGRHLLAMVNEILDLARIESGRIEVLAEPLALAEIVASALEQTRPLAERRRLRTRVDVGPDAVAIGDAMRVRQVLLNLLSNAVKYNREGGRIEVLARVEEGWARVEVVDSGPGIAPAARERLFAPFERLVSSYEGIEGTGIGLALVKRLVEAMGGAIGLESEVGVGSVFWFTLPLAPAADPLGQPKVGAGETAPEAS